MKKISAIIVNWNGKDVTAECIESLLAQDYPDLEIIVSDNGSTDGSIEYIKERFPSARLIENGKNLGFGAAVNRGLQTASGDYFIFLNNDLYLQPNSLSELVRLLESDSSIGAAVPKILYYEKRNVINSFGVLVHYSGMACPNLIDQEDSDSLEILETACGGIFLFKREVFEATQGFDEDFFLYHEDHDLSWRIRLMGWKIMVCPKAVIYHHYHFSKGTFKFYSSEKNRLLLLFKLFEWKTLVLISPALFIIEIAQWVHALMNGWFGLKAKSYFEVLRLFPKILRKRVQAQAARKITDKEIISLHSGILKIAGVKNRLLDKVLSPLVNAYWNLIRRWI
jgi:GT2 family glycosyltransferase